MQPGDHVRKKDNPGRVGILLNETSGEGRRLKVLVKFADEQEYVLHSTLELIPDKYTPMSHYDLIRQGKLGRAHHLRGMITYYRLSGKLSNLIYSLNTTNTEFFAYQFKPVLQFFETQNRSILIADEVGLGKTIEAGLIWTELQAREKARKLLVVCPAMLREKWKHELKLRFGLNSQIVDANKLLQEIEQNNEFEQSIFICSLEGIRPPKNIDSNSSTGKLARYLESKIADKPLFDLVIIDEAHKLRNPSTSTHQVGRMLRPIASAMVMLSATPIQLKSDDLFSLLNILDSETFKFPDSFNSLLSQSRPVNKLRDLVRQGKVRKDDLKESLEFIYAQPLYSNNNFLQHLLQNLPNNEYLQSIKGRSELSERLDRLSPFTKVLTRTLKREVTENRVIREPHIIRVDMSPVEEKFYRSIRHHIINYCFENDYAEGFIVTLPSKQMTSSMYAACESWQNKDFPLSSQDAEFNQEIIDIEETGESEEVPIQLMSRLHEASQKFKLKQLENNDSKFSRLVFTLKKYWESNPGKKIILFSFYRKTLEYLQRRLNHEGIQSALLYGGMDKQTILKEFASCQNTNILLSSEVAAEGVDLQFSSVLINYDLPWNPAKIEQRIGRIDRIGQKEPLILIWNFVYAHSLDDNILTRLFQRLRVFEESLGMMESVLGRAIQNLTYKLLSHDLTEEQIKESIDQTSLAIENENQFQSKLDADAINLMAHGDYILNKINAAKNLKRYIDGADLYLFCKDFFDKFYPGTKISSTHQEPGTHIIRFDPELERDFSTFIENNHLQSQTRLFYSSQTAVRFVNKVGGNNEQENITQSHPLIQFAINKYQEKQIQEVYYPSAAIELATSIISPGVYIYIVEQWSVVGSHITENLEYLLASWETGEVLSSEIAEEVINVATELGVNWLSPQNELDLEAVAKRYDEHQEEMENRYAIFREHSKVENKDRIQMLKNNIMNNYQSNKTKIEQQIEHISQMTDERSRRVLPIYHASLADIEETARQQLEKIHSKADPEINSKIVSCGLIKIRPEVDLYDH